MHTVGQHSFNHECIHSFMHTRVRMFLVPVRMYAYVCVCMRMYAHASKFAHVSECSVCVCVCVCTCKRMCACAFDEFIENKMCVSAQSAIFFTKTRQIHCACAHMPAYDAVDYILNHTQKLETHGHGMPRDTWSWHAYCSSNCKQAIAMRQTTVAAAVASTSRFYLFACRLT